MEIRYIYTFFYISIFLMIFLSLYVLFRIYYIKRLIKLAELSYKSVSDSTTESLKRNLKIRKQVNPLSKSTVRIFRRLKPVTNFTEHREFPNLQYDSTQFSLFRVYEKINEKSEK